MLDVRTIFVVDAITTAFIGLALFFYGRSSRTYPGFNHWMLGSLLVSMGYVATFMREVIPDLLSILLVNGGFVLSGVIRLDGVMRFLRGKKLHRALYCLPLIAMATAGYFTIVHDSMAIRLAFLTLWICPLLWSISAVFLGFAPERNRAISYLGGGIIFLYGVTMLVRTGFWISQATILLFDNSWFNSTFFISVLMFEIWSGLIVMMMNNQRMEAELLQVQDTLRDNVVRLENYMSEVKILKGLLPICSCCKKIRDDRGYWKQLESYIDEHSEATFTHGICPECAVKMRMELDLLKPGADTSGVPERQ